MNVYFESRFLPERPTVIFGSSLGADGRMWKDQVEAISGAWNTITFDLRGHGKSPLSATTPTIDAFADDVIAIADRLGVERFSYCGLSIGGTIGQSLGARYPHRIQSLVLAATGLTILTPQGLAERAARVRAEGMNWIAEVSASRWFTEEFRRTSPSKVEEKMAVMRSMNPEGYAGACLALAGFNGESLARRVVAPTLVIAGADDVATPPASGEKLAASIGGARYELIPAASHLCNMEQPEKFNALLQAHLKEHG